ncbi:MAG: hypothetical protein L0387_43390 [Acidobacteria bacterium]|nr:hypothetical protein [Acidobacteriota bacterium]MCI0628430.1 hypothetical protein [Acidobacteriota bacterium]MCI0724069.1 hypothetical protein [Acidobacteriota bacterium]
MNNPTESFGPTGQTPTSSGFDREAERAGHRVGAQVGRLAESAGTKFDTAVDYMEETAQTVKQSFQAMTDEGWEGMKKKAIEYTRKEPLNALLLAIGTGILVGWATRRAR